MLKVRFVSIIFEILLAFSKEVPIFALFNKTITNQKAGRRRDKNDKNKMFTVYYNCPVEIFEVAKFETLEEAKAYCEKEVQGLEEIYDNDTDCDSSNKALLQRV